MTILIIISIVLILWSFIGWLLLQYWGKAAGNRNYRRSFDRQKYTLGETIKVTLALMPPANPYLAEARDVLLVLDCSDSMGSAPGSPLREALRVAENWVSRLPAPFHIGLIAFNHEAQLLCRITDKKQSVLEVLGAVSLGGGTAIHFALDKCRDALKEGREGIQKTVILLSDGGSDRSQAEEAAQQLREYFSGLQILCIGFGAYVEIGLLKSISDSENFIHKDKVSQLEDLFALLANAISQNKAVTCFVSEGVAAHPPFSLENTGGFYPTSVQTEPETRITWSVPLLEQQPIKLTYELTPKCIGWHTVALPDSKAIWKMPNGEDQESQGPKGPKVLILPQRFEWASFLMPLWLFLFKKKCPSSFSEKVNGEVKALSSRPLPEPVPPPKVDIYTAKLRPALVIGLGKLGEMAICRLKNQLRERGLDAIIDLVVIQDGDFHNRPTVTVGNCSLRDQDRVVLKQDLRPYLEKIREHKLDGTTRNWVPWQQWLGETVPLTRCAQDRRKARLALLLQPDAVENRIQKSIERISALNSEQSGMVVIVGDASDAETSGLLAEIAHICATHKMGTTAILNSTVSDGDNSRQVAGMMNELERMITLRGEAVVSDRGGVSKTANKLFDRIISINGEQDVTRDSVPIANLVWAMLAYPEILTQQMPIANSTGCYQVKLHSHNYPQLSLWEWARERTLSQLINQQWLGLNMAQEPLTLPATDTDVINDYIDQFWHGSNSQRPSGQFLKQSALILSDEKPNPLKFIMEQTDTETDAIPLARPYHEQKVFCDHERQIFLAYLEEWCHIILENEQDKHHWGLLVLWHTLQRLEQDFETLIDSMKKLSGNEYFMSLLAFILSIYIDYRAILNGVLGNVEHWISVFVGWQPNMTVNRLPKDFTAVCWKLEEQRKTTEKRLQNQPGYDAMKAIYEQWFEENSTHFMEQLRFRLVSKEQHFLIQLQYFDCTLEAGDNIPAVFREKLDRYQDVVCQWSAEDWVTAENISEPINWERVGKFSQQGYPNLNRAPLNQDDPFFTAALLVTEIQPDSLKTAFSVNQIDGSPIYTWSNYVAEN
ncbi:MAG: hypothetical protein DRQ41_04705 [Gammaproteobacteria bacterium]|nr:MAG: hypothetical protein DRQ41_04705 [Gammaproteobacteria bacterium]